MGDEGLTWNNAFYAFRPMPRNGFSRKDLAALVSVHPRSLKRIELRSSALATGRIAINRLAGFF